MKQRSGFTFFEVLVVLLLFLILMTLSVLTLTPHKRMVKTDDAAGALYTLMRQARIQAITRLQFFAVVINAAGIDQVIPLNNSTTSIKFPKQSVSLVDMGSITSQTDEELYLSKKLPADVTVNATTGLPPSATFPIPEQSFVVPNLSASTPSGTYVVYFDPAGRAVDKADGTGVQEYRTFYFSSLDINVSKSPTLLRAVTLYGATGGLKFWRFIPTPAPAQWKTQLS